MRIKKILLLFMSLFLIMGLVQVPADAKGDSTILKLGVNDKLSKVEAVSVKGTYYVPLRALADELKWTLTGLTDRIHVAGGTGSLTLLSKDGGAVLKDGTAVPMSTFVQDGKLMAPLKLSGYLGYSISYAGDKYLLRVKDGSAQLTDAAFTDKYAAELKPKAPVAPVTPVTPVQPTEPGKPGRTVYLTLTTARQPRLATCWTSCVNMTYRQPSSCWGTI